MSPTIGRFLPEADNCGACGVLLDGVSAHATWVITRTIGLQGYGPRCRPCAARACEKLAAFHEPSVDTPA